MVHSNMLQVKGKTRQWFDLYMKTHERTLFTETSHLCVFVEYGKSQQQALLYVIHNQLLTIHSKMFKLLKFS